MMMVLPSVFMIMVLFLVMSFDFWLPNHDKTIFDQLSYLFSLEFPGFWSFFKRTRIFVVLDCGFGIFLLILLLVIRSVISEFSLFSIFVFTFSPAGIEILSTSIFSATPVVIRVSLFFVVLIVCLFFFTSFFNFLLFCFFDLLLSLWGSRFFRLFNFFLWGNVFNWTFLFMFFMVFVDDFLDWFRFWLHFLLLFTYCLFRDKRKIGLTSIFFFLSFFLFRFFKKF